VQCPPGAVLRASHFRAAVLWRRPQRYGGRAGSRRAARQARAAGRTLDDDGVDPQMPNVRMVRDPGLGRFLTK